MEITRATSDDIDAIGRVHALSRHATYDGLLPPEALQRINASGQAAYWRRRLAAEPLPHAVYVVRVDGTVEGFTMGAAEVQTASLHGIHVLPARHGSGAGQALHDRLVEDFATWGCSAAQLWVLEGNERAQSFYRRNGWALDGGRDVATIGGAGVPILRYRRPVTSATTHR